jgi:hypothetical protein
MDSHQSKSLSLELPELRPPSQAIGPAFWAFAITATLAISASIYWLLTRPEAYAVKQPETGLVAAGGWSRARTNCHRISALRLWRPEQLDAVANR